VSGKLGNPGQVQWDGKYVTYEGRSPGSIKISRLQISGSTATVVGTTRFRGELHNALQSWIAGNRILVPYSTRGQLTNKIGVWAYPQGGKILSKFRAGSKFAKFRGVTLSFPS
jgi:hypothetical protein